MKGSRILRFAVCGVCYMMLVNNIMIQVSMSIATVCMVNYTWLEGLSNTTRENSIRTNVTSSECSKVRSGREKMVDGPFQWEKDLQGYIQSAYFAAYTASVLLTGWLHQHVSSRLLIAISMTLAAVAVGAIPLLAPLHHAAVIALRAVVGVASASVIPGAVSTIAAWAPARTRQRYLSLVATSINLGATVGLALGGWLCAVAGWAAIFYVFAAYDAVCVLLWLLLVHDTVQQHPVSRKNSFWTDPSNSASSAENCQQPGQQPAVERKQRKHRIPFVRVVSSAPVWALLTAYAGYGWLLFTMVISMNQYLREVLLFDPSENGQIAAIPTLAQIGIMFLVTLTADLLQLRWQRSRTCVRKLFVCGGFLLSAAAITALGWIDCASTALVILFLILAAITIGANAAGVFQNNVELAPALASLIVGACETVLNLVGFAVPVVVNRLTRDRTQAQWRNAFYVAAAVQAFAAVVFLVFGSAEEQEWAIMHNDAAAAANDEKKTVGEKSTNSSDQEVQETLKQTTAV